ncbi:MAG: hypothetical protein WCE48_02500 [Steroidobacteraceae bacterium]
MNISRSSTLRQLLAGVFAALVVTFSSAAAADPVIRIVHLTAAGVDQQQQVMKMVDTDINKLYKAAKGCRWVKYFFDAKTLDTGSVSMWNSRADVEAFLKSDAYKPVPEKLKPLMTGSLTSQVYSVHTPK